MASVPRLSDLSSDASGRSLSANPDLGSRALSPSVLASTSRDPGSFEIRPTILRGARISTVLQSFGKHLRTSPIDLPMATRGALWAKSSQCETLDVFISQSWTAPGWLKYLTLLLRFYLIPAAIASVSCMITLMILDGFNLLPTLGARLQDRMGWDSSKGQTFISPWCVIPPCMGLVALLLAPSIPSLRKSIVFFDALCINQVDQDVMLEGVYSLPGFVANSKELLILWCPSYFRRAWCILEIAAFVSAHGQSGIMFRPLFVSTSMVIAFVLSTTWCGFVTALDCSEYVAMHETFSWVGRTLVFVILAFFVGQLRVQLHGLRSLASELERFDFGAVQCRVDSDLEFIKENIEALWDHRQIHFLRSAEIGGCS